VPLSGLEPIAAGLRRGDPSGSWTLARAQISATPERIRIEREPGRRPLPSLTLAAGGTALWDGRFVVEVGARFEGGVEVRALGLDGVNELRRLGGEVRPARAFRLVASFWQGTSLLAVPQAGYWADAGLERLLSATFVGLRCNSEGRRR
jgi:hypothetical protein